MRLVIVLLPFKLVAYHGDTQVVLDGIEPSFPVCKTGVVAVGPQDFRLGWRLGGWSLEGILVLG